jgi:O-antigen/teichoic acid export membrane protein
MAAQQIDSIIIFQLLGPVQLAIYTFSTIIPDRIRSMFGIISTLAFPKLAEKDNDQSRASIKGKVWRLVFLSVIIIVIYVLAAPFIYRVFFPQYLETVFYSQVFALSLLAIASNIPVPALFTQKKQGGLYVVSVGLPIAKIVISVIGILLWGIWGALIAKILHHIFQVIVSTSIASKPIENK